MSLPSDSTISTIWTKLADPRPYVGGILGKLRTCSNEHGNAYVVIGITGSGQKPCYRVFHKSPAGTEVIYGSYWDNHQPLDNQDAITANWSSSSMSYAEVDAFLREKINWKK